jgi:hypothetical protein
MTGRRGSDDEEASLAPRRALVVCSALFATGCVSTLTPPRTVPAGQSRSYVLLEIGGENRVMPRYMLRHGITSRVDEGFQIGPLMGGADLKWNAVRGPVDLAWDPGAIAWDGPSLRGTPLVISSEDNPTGPQKYLVTALLGAPLLVGFNFAPRVTLVTLGGADLMLRDGERPHALYRAGIGFNWRPRPRFAVQFELDGLLDVPRGAGAARPEPLVVGGVGFAFGRSSEYDGAGR